MVTYSACRELCLLSGDKASQKGRGEQRQLHFDDSGINDDNSGWRKGRKGSSKVSRTRGKLVLRKPPFETAVGSFLFKGSILS
jgi:hypothetical protein